ncbi:MAG: tetratricopeptide repeat protein [Gemmatimonadota bacterium]|nr:tetratricopeptide repeat protein [Gemmatimonadota bacterium]
MRGTNEGIGPSIVRLVMVVAMAATASLTACAPGDEQNAIQRGDIAFATGRTDEALAEYRLAMRQSSDDAEIHARVAHTYARLGRVDDAGQNYANAVAVDSSYVGQAVSDLMRLARNAHQSGDAFAMATAVETALDLEPAVGVTDLALPLARHYFESGEYGQALPFYQVAMSEMRDSTPEIVFEVGQAYEEIGDCERALVFFERFRARARPWERGEVDWYIGTCAFNVAEELLEGPDAGEEEMERAIVLLDRALEVGEPRNIQARAWFEKGETLADLGRCEQAMEAYAQVRYTDQAGSLVDRAQAAFDEIRFGRGLEHLRGGRCR